MFKNSLPATSPAPFPEELKLNQLSKVFFNAKTGIWYNSKQQIVWDKDYFNRHISSNR